MSVLLSTLGEEALKSVVADGMQDVGGQGGQGPGGGFLSQLIGGGGEGQESQGPDFAKLFSQFLGSGYGR